MEGGGRKSASRTRGEGVKGVFPRSKDVATPSLEVPETTPRGMKFQSPRASNNDGRPFSHM